MEEKLTIIDRISLAISSVAKWFVAFIVIIISYEVVMRYLFEMPTLWVNEMSMWTGGSIYLLAGIYTMQVRGHIRITALYDAVPRGVQRVFDTISLIVIVLFAAGVGVGGFKSASQAFRIWEKFGTAWDPPIPATIKPMVLIVAAIVAIQAISNFIVDIRKPKEKHELKVGDN
ncbi:MAG: TRAP transporter small permease subunit [Alphaproteobacteria bacterium]|nr:TRAP transporter small permease subunit [Alphaproteobacteria bacterium]